VPPEADSESLTLTVVAESAPSDVRIDAARWSQSRDDDGGVLRVRGSGAGRHEMVGLLDADTGLVLASKQAGRRGRFRFEVEPMIAPCAVQVQAGDVRSERIPVGGAPADCGQQVRLEAEAKMSCDEEDGLSVKGKRAPAGATVGVLDPGTGAALGSAQADGRGRFHVRSSVTRAPRAVDLTVSAGDGVWTLEGLSVESDECDHEDDSDDDEEDDEDLELTR
jgi:hypothetical protein